MRINFERVLMDELQRIYPRIRMPPNFMLGIIKRLKLDLDRFAHHRLSSLARQVESTFCYSMIKLQLMRELENQNPNLTCLIKGYKVERSSIEKAPYYALTSYEQNKGPLM